MPQRQQSVLSLNIASSLCTLDTWLLLFRFFLLSIWGKSHADMWKLSLSGSKNVIKWPIFTSLKTLQKLLNHRMFLCWKRPLGSSNKHMEFIPCSEIRLVTVSRYFDIIYDWNESNECTEIGFKLYLCRQHYHKIQFHV